MKAEKNITLHALGAKVYNKTKCRPKLYGFTCRMCHNVPGKRRFDVILDSVQAPVDSEKTESKM